MATVNRRIGEIVKSADRRSSEGWRVYIGEEVRDGSIDGRRGQG